MVRGAPEALIEQNAFHLHLKLTLGARDQEISALKDASTTQKKEFDDLKARFETLNNVHQYVEPSSSSKKSLKVPPPE